MPSNTHVRAQHFIQFRTGVRARARRSKTLRGPSDGVYKGIRKVQADGSTCIMLHASVIPVAAVSTYCLVLSVSNLQIIRYMYIDQTGPSMYWLSMPRDCSMTRASIAS